MLISLRFSMDSLNTPVTLAEVRPLAEFLVRFAVGVLDELV